MVKTRPVFVDTDTALRLSFAVLAGEVRMPCSLRQVLIRMLEAEPSGTAQQRLWLDELLGEPSGLVDFAGLTANEIRGQCALVVAAAAHRLTEAEHFAMLARYAQSYHERAAGVHGLVALLLPAAPTGNHAALLDLMWRRYLPTRYLGGYSLRDIAQRTHVARQTLWRLAAWLREQCDAMELQALQRLEESFVRHGVCDTFNA
ncbi:hypothetical protein [Cupriavidus taiwanensis]|uniref:hypothetical protein n=1 Tax=Cupriavidus taiwanensis TaxID=164546 RepID=UPI000E142FA8|nr:hypothetical protein [Cupriavidus taiwanensis]SPA17221.1 GP66 [Cupriavidus taiwanensis]